MVVSAKSVILNNLIIGPAAAPPPPVSNTVQLFHLDSQTVPVLDKLTYDALVPARYMTLADYDPIAISTSYSQFGAGSLAMTSGTTGDSFFPDPSVSSDKWTFEFSTFVPTASPLDSGGVLFRFDESGSRELQLEFSSSPGSGQYSMNFNGITDNSLVASENIWTQWAIVIDGTANTYRIFRNGIIVFSTTASTYNWTSTPWNPCAGTTGRIGRGGYNYNTDPFYTDEVRISDAALYTANYTPSAGAFTS